MKLILAEKNHDVINCFMRQNFSAGPQVFYSMDAHGYSQAQAVHFLQEARSFVRDFQQGGGNQ
jgi:hypothetical protein